MDFNYTLKYRTFDQLLDDVRVDMKSFSLEGKIDPQVLIKIALKCNYDLGLRINMIKQKVLCIEHGKARLPDDFFVMNYALLCGTFTTTRVLPQGTWIEEVPESAIIPVYKAPDDPNPCTDPLVDPNCPTKMVNTTTPLCLSRCGTGFQLVQKINTETRTFSMMYPIRFRNSKDINCNCPNLNWMSYDEAYLKDGFIFMGINRQVSNNGNITNDRLTDGNLFIDYEGGLEDDDGNILVPDHPMLNEYYEYALKKKILESMIMDGDNVVQQMQMIIPELRAARNNALTIVNTPNFSEMAKTWESNRKAMYHKYYQMFESYPSTINFRHNNAV
jgi:hypothetical protein